MRKKLVSAIDGIRNNLHNMRNDTESTEEFEFELAMEEKIAPQNCSLSKIVRHGFPEEPRCLAFDAVQRLVAVGGARGALRLLGEAGVDVHLKHDSNEPVLHAHFLVNEGGLVTALRDDTLHLWNYRQTTPKIVNSLKMAKERITCVYLPFQSKWLYVGTDKGNAYFLALANFELSAYVINWNKAIDVSCRTHPGAIRQFSLCPTDPSRLLIVFDAGHVVLWNFQTRESERFAVDHAPVKCVSWHNDGRQFMCGHRDGSLTIWNLKKPRELVHKTTPHAPNESRCKCRPITNLHWSANADGEQMILFAGGMPEEEGVLPALTILRARGSITVLEMDHAIVEVCPLYASPHATTPQHPYGVAVLLKADLLTVDLMSHGYPCFESPYAMDIHESPVTFLRYFADCPVDLIAALTLVGRAQRRQGARLSERPWPITGGIGRECATGHQEVLLTGHEDGSIKFWQASSENLQIMYKLKTGRHFERVTAQVAANSTTTMDTVGTTSSATTTTNSSTTTTTSSSTSNATPSTTTTVAAHNYNTANLASGAAAETASTASSAPSMTSSGATGGPDSTPPSTSAAFVAARPTSPSTTTGAPSMSTVAQVSHAVTAVELCVDSRLLLVAGASGQVTLFRFVKTESCQEIAVVLLPQLCSSPVAGAPPPTTPTPSMGATDDDAASGAGGRRGGTPQRGTSASSTQRAELRRQTADTATLSSRDDSRSTDTSCGSQTADQMPIKVRGGALRRPAGYQPELVCQIPWLGGHTPERVTALALNSAFGLLAVATAGGGMALVDIATSTPVYAWTSAELHSRDAIPFHTALAYHHHANGGGGAPTSAAPFESEILRHCGTQHQLSPQLSPHQQQEQQHHQQQQRRYTKAVRRSTSLTCDAGEPKPPSAALIICRRLTEKRANLSMHHHNQSMATNGAAVGSAPSVSSSGAPPLSATLSGNLAKSFVRLNTDVKSRTMERQRPVLSKAQSMAVPSCTLNAPNASAAGNHDATTSFVYGNQPGTSNGELFNGESGGREPYDSRSSSTGSLEQLESTAVTSALNHHHSSLTHLHQTAGASPSNNEFVTSLTFINSFSKKGCAKSEPSLWLGMSSGVCVAFNLILPANRILANVVVAPSGSVVRLKGRILYSAFLNKDFCLVGGASEAFRDPAKDSAPPSANLEKAVQNRVLTKVSLSPTISNVQDASTSATTNAGCPPEEFSQLGVFVSEYEIRVIALPGYSQFFHHKPEIPLVKAKTSHIRGYPVLICLNGASHVVVFSLPSLRPLLQAPLFRGSVEVDDIMCQKTEFSENGLGMYASSPSEVEKFTVNAELAAQMAECSGELFVPCDMPEPPKTSFLRGVSTLFGGTSQRDNVDLDTIFSEKPANAVTNVKSVAKQIPSNSHAVANNIAQMPQLSQMEGATSRSITAGQAAGMALQNLSERGEKLNAVVDATENLRSNAMNLQSRSSKLVEKYEKKKWYQL